MLRSLILALGVLIALPAAAQAADVVSPVDGETVGSRPQFLFDFASGSASVELSRSPDVKTTGDDAGAFVERDGGDFILIGPDFDLQPGIGQPWGGLRLNAGRYFWHAGVDALDDDVFTDTWTPVRTLSVRDEPVILEGYTARAKRLSARGSCRVRIQVGGRIDFDDNDADASIRYTVAFYAGGRTVGRARGTMTYDTDYSGVICTSARRLRVTVSLRDRGGYLVGGTPRSISVR